MSNILPNKTKNWFLSIIILWLAWAFILIGFQKIVTLRFNLVHPDNVIGWTATETESYSQNEKIYLVEPFLNQQVSWDSEYYLSIASLGYNDPAILVGTRKNYNPSPSYAFFPLYPLMIRFFTLPLKLLGLNPIATLSLAGVIVSLLGTFLAMVSLYHLAFPYLGEDGAWRSVFYFLIFPSGFFLATVYTEGLFSGLAFASLALLQVSRTKKWALLAAGFLAALTVLTRSVGIVLVVAIVVQVLRNELETRQVNQWKMIMEVTRFLHLRSTLIALVAMSLPIVTYLVWSTSVFGERFRIAQEGFGRGTLIFKETIDATVRIYNAFHGIGQTWEIGDPTKSALYFGLEFIAVLLALAGVIACFRQYPAVTAFSFFAWLIPVFSGSPQSLVRYMLVLPTTYLLLSRLGQNRIFDRVWTILSIMLMTLLALLFSFDFWVA